MNRDRVFCDLSLFQILQKQKKKKEVLPASLANIDVDRIKNDSCSKNFRQFDETRRDVIRFIFIIDEFLSLLSFLFSLIPFYIYFFLFLFFLKFVVKFSWRIMDSKYVYIKKRNQFGKQCFFEDIGPTVEEDIVPEPRLNKSFIHQEINHGSTQESVQYALHEVRSDLP